MFENIEVPTGINKFASAQQAEAAQPADHVFILRSSDLQEIIRQATNPLEQKISEMNRIIQIYINPDPAILDLNHPDSALMAEAATKRAIASKEYGVRLISLENDVNILFEHQRHNNEAHKPERYSSKVEGHLKTIEQAILDRERQSTAKNLKWDFMSFWEVADLLNLSHRRVSQLAEIARNDPHFVIGWHPKKKNQKVFRLNHLTLGDIASQLHKDLYKKT